MFLRVLFIDDHPLAVEGLKVLFEIDEDNNIDIVYGFSNVEEALGADPLNFDVILLDLFLKGYQNPLNNVKTLKERFPDKPIVIYTCEDSMEWKKKMFDAGVISYIVKTATIEEIKNALETASNVEVPKFKYYFESLLDNMVEGVAIHEMVFDENNKPINYIILDINKSYEKILNLKREDVVGKLASEVYGDVPALEHYSEIVLEKCSRKFDFYYPAMDRYFCVSASPWEKGFITIFSDITDAKEKQSNYRALLNAMPDMMTRVRKDGTILDIKPGVGTYSDLGQSTFYIGSNILELPFGEVITNEFKNVINEVLEKNEPIEFCYSIKIKNQDRHYYSRTVKSSENEVIVIVRDTTEETNIGRELRNSKDFSENLMDTANVMVIGLDLKGNITIFNRASEDLTGYKKEEVLGKNWFDEIPILIKDDIPRINTIFNDILGDRIVSNEVENPIITKDGEIKYILWRNNEVRENGVVVGTISFGLDISDRKKFEQDIIEAKNKAEQSDKMKLEFLANMSHDLRTPMNSIIGFSDLLKSNNLSKNDKHDYLNTIINNGKFLMALIDDIIDISKIDAGNLKIENNEFEINKLMEDLRSTYFKQVKDKKLDIIIDIDVNKNIIINTDKYRLKQIMMNLIGNAIKFTQDGYVKFGYKIINSKQLEIYVEDTGIGIERQYQKIIFERFKQIGKNNKFKGAGLGLSITKSLVELLGFKEIRLISELERGSKFYFYVPYTVKHYNYINEIKASRKNKKMNFAGKNILLIEDTADSRTIIKSYLAPTNATVIEVSDGLKVMDIIKSTHIDLVLLDLGLPTIDGYEVLRRIREHSDRLPVIIESALVMPDQKSKAFELGCDDFISKPYSREDFLNKIDNLI